jgi:hypothetical protein
MGMNIPDLIPYYFGFVIIFGLFKLEVLNHFNLNQLGTIVSITAIYILFGVGLASVKGFEYTSHLGDFVSPIIALIGAVLVYKTIIIQVDANKAQKEGLEKETEYRNAIDEINSITKSIDSIKEDIRNLSLVYRDNQQLITVTGISALKKFSILKNTGIDGTFESTIQTIASVMFDLVNVRGRILKLKKSRRRDELYLRTKTIYALGISKTIQDYIFILPKNSSDLFSYEWDIIYHANNAFKEQENQYELYPDL